MAVTAVIPARYGSTRFPGKPLADRTGKPLIQHVYERAQQAKLIDRVLVATDDDRIAGAVRAFGGEAMMTRTDHPNGTSRIAEVAASLDSPIIANIQGDEPEIEPALIDLAIQTLLDHPDCSMSTIASPFGAREDAANPNIVKVVIDQRGHAMYFSRARIPEKGVGSLFLKKTPDPPFPLKHVGMYVYRREFLLKYMTLSPTPLEQIESLEQLRALEHGYRIVVAIGEVNFHGIDTPDQYEAFVQRMKGCR